MRAALIAALVLTAVPATAPALSRGAAPDPDACAGQIKRQVAHVRPAAPAACWRLGPVTLGMTQDEVASVLGPPDSEGEGPPATLPSKVDRKGYRDAYYLFPRDLARRLARGGATPARLDLRLLQVSYFQGRAVRMDSGPPAEFRSTPCQGHPAEDIAFGGDAEGFAPFRAFAGVREGDPITTLTHRFGKPNTVSTARDFYTYMPAPLTLGVDPEHKTVGSFSIGADTDAVFLGGMAHLEFTRTPATCRISGVRFLARGPAGG